MRSLKFLFAVLFLSLVPSLVSAQTSAQNFATGTISAASTACTPATSCVTLYVAQKNFGGVAIAISGGYSATLQFEGSSDATGVLFSALGVTPLASGSVVTSTSGTGTWVANIAGLNAIRVRCSSYSSGLPVITIQGSTASAILPGTGGGGGGSGTVTEVDTVSPISGGPITTSGSISCSTCGVTGSPLSQFAATTSAQFAGVISDETGTGKVVFGTSPAFLGTPDASGATQFKLPVAAGFATAANGEAGFDTTNGNWHVWNVADSFLFTGLVSGTYTNGDCTQFTKTSNAVTITDAGAACSAAGANQALSNLSAVSINTSLLAQTGVDAGSTTKPFRNMFLWGTGTYGTTYMEITGVPTSTRVWTLQDATDTLVGRATTDTFTNKTFNTAGTGNTFQINGTGITAVSGTGAVALVNSPSFITPTLGAASATTINNVTITQPAGSATISISNGKTFSDTNSITLSGTDATTMTFPSSSATVAGLGINQTFNGGQTFTGLFDAHTATSFRPKFGLIAAIPGTCVVGDVYEATDATAGQNWYFCTATNTFTQQLNTGASGANATLSNLSAVAVNAALAPGTDNSISLDSLTKRYINFWSSGVFGWTNGSGTADTGLSRDSAGVVDIGNGTAADVSGTAQAAAFQTSGSNGGITGTEGTGAGLTAGGGTDLFYPDSSSHCWHQNLNNTDSGCTASASNTLTMTNKTFVAPALGAATATSLVASGIVDGQAPITITTGTTGNLGGTFQSGYTFNQEATAGTGVTYTLPATAAGKQYCVQNSGTTSVINTGVLTVYPPASSFVILNGVVNTVGGGGSHGVASAGAAGDGACFVAIDATHWEVFPLRGTWVEN